MSPFDLLFLASVLCVLVLIVRVAVAALRRRWPAMRRYARGLSAFTICYGLTLISVALVVPRRFFAPGQRRCFDDWCVTAVDAKRAEEKMSLPCEGTPGSKIWIATIQVSSEARRIRQRAPDARAELEDQQGRRNTPCGAPLSEAAGPPRLLSDLIGPGESFRVLLPYRLPSDTRPAGLILHHGDFPGMVIIGADQSWLHPLALQRLDVK